MEKMPEIPIRIPFCPNKGRSKVSVVFRTRERLKKTAEMVMRRTEPDTAFIKNTSCHAACYITRGIRQTDMLTHPFYPSPAEIIRRFFLCGSGMRTMYRKSEKTIRSSDNSPFRRHFGFLIHARKFYSAIICTIFVRNSSDKTEPLSLFIASLSYHSPIFLSITSHSVLSYSVPDICRRYR